jgi:hypothetical protein
MDDFIRFGSAQGCAVRTGALKSGWAVQDKKMARAAFLLLTFLWLFKEHDSLELRNCVSVSHHLLAVKGERPTMKVKPNAYKRRLTNQSDLLG